MVVIEGQVERITYRNESDGYTVAKIKIKGENSLVTIVGYISSLACGEILRVKGYWENNKRFGTQFHVVSYESIPPGTVQAIEKYLGSGMIKGIGPELAKRIVSTFGKDTLKIISSDVERLREVPSIKEKRIQMIKEGWQKTSEFVDVIISLQSLGITQSMALKIFKHYGRDAVKIVKTNPYRLAQDIYGIGFLTADRIAKTLNIEKDSNLRIESAIEYVLKKAEEEGHVYYPLEKLVNDCSALLEIDESKVRDVLPKVLDSGKIVIEESYPERPVYLKGLYIAEVVTSERLKKIASGAKRLGLGYPEGAIEKVEKKLSLNLTEAQRLAIRTSLENKITIITGGPGTGKTTVVKGILEAYKELGAKVFLCAPTGRAAKKMEEATGYEAQTIHRLLEYNPNTKAFRRNEKYPLDCDLIVVDESSMVDIVLMHHLIKALPLHASIVFVGDVDQLPSVGPGTVFKDMIESQFAKTVRLKEVFRQSKESLIVTNAHRINRGIMPILDGKKDFLFYHRDEPESVIKTIIDLVFSHIPSKYGIPKEEIQVLTPMYKGEIGVSNLNSVLKDVINPAGEELQRGGKSFRVGDKVIQMRNNYEKDVYNGDIGKITAIDKDNGEIRVLYDLKEVSYDLSELDEIMPAYAISIHKSQGSEYEAVIVPVMTHHYVLLQRNLIYTALTRAKKLAVFIGTKKALAIAIKNNKPTLRYSLLKERLKLNTDGILF
ncbi:MAG: ATP-dependent RecD-like DNA helicase [Desulfobacterota bacterium]|nr:ATP-dependent RecD-like DNA helicase [Thermodesulfobacteriota bacterium]MDW8001184.1 ATP-dependent RecD-like DNA helicase [Deltaproteobacteria bacterium]